MRTGTVFQEFVFFEKDDRTDGKNLPIVQLSDEASGLLTALCTANHMKGNNHIIPMSRGIIKNGKPHVAEGPLAGYEDRIVKVDRHKRICWVRLGYIRGQLRK